MPDSTATLSLSLSYPCLSATPVSAQVSNPSAASYHAKVKVLTKGGGGPCQYASRRPSSFYPFLRLAAKIFSVTDP